jgi:hypothetical protein
MGPMRDLRRGMPSRPAGLPTLANWVVQAVQGRRPAGSRMGLGPKCSRKLENPLAFQTLL